jgi:hypothetical protein
VIVGLDLRKPKLSAEFNLNEVGIVNYLLVKRSLKDIVNPTISFRCYTIGSHSPNPSINIDGAMAD